MAEACCTLYDCYNSLHTVSLSMRLNTSWHRIAKETSILVVSLIALAVSSRELHYVVFSSNTGDHGRFAHHLPYSVVDVVYL